MYVGYPKCVMVLIMGIIYCFSLTIPSLNSILQVAEPVMAQETCPPLEPREGCLVIQKQVSGSTGLVTSWKLEVRESVEGTGQSKIVGNGDFAAFALDEGTYTIIETPDTAVGITDDCNSDFTVSITEGDTQRCTIQNSGSAIDQSNPTQSPALVKSEGSAQAGRATGAGETLGIINPPFDVCLGNFLSSDANNLNFPVTGTKIVGEADTNLVRAPNSATYTAGGRIDLSDVSQALERFGTNIISIQLYSDFNVNQPNGPSLAISAPQFRGAIMVEDSEGIKHEVINFNLETIRTECKFITIAKARGDSPLRNVYPLGVVGENDDTKPSEINEILIQEKARLLTSISENVVTPVLNPPFATCDILKRAASGSTSTTLGSEFSDDDFGIYSIRGEIDELGSVHGDKLNMELTVDLNLARQDLAQITANNNPYARVNLIVDEDEESAHKIPFTINDVWTDCKDLSLNTSPLFEPIQSEISP